MLPPDDDPALQALDALYADRSGGDWWDRFYADRHKPVPFFGSAPDECLVEWVGADLVAPGAALDLGCGNGRNAVYLAQQGFGVDAVDQSATACAWARERCQAAGVNVRLHHVSLWQHPVAPASLDLVVDSGCFHHLPPHRRGPYVQRVAAALKPGGWFSMVCFRPEGGSGLTDEQVLAQHSLGGGLGYTEAQLRSHWGTALQVHTLRPMRPQPAGGALFGQPFLWALLARKQG